MSVPSTSTKPCVGRSRPDSEPQQRALAAARAADHDGDLAGVDGERDAANGLGAVGVRFADAADFKHGASQSAGCKRILPPQEWPRDGNEQPVGQLAEEGEDEDDGHDLGRLADLLAIDEQIAQAFGRTHELGGDDEHPAEAEPPRSART